MAGGEQTRDNNSKGFDECVSQEQLQAVVEDVQKWMNAAVTDAHMELNIGNSKERLDKQISTLTDKVTELKPWWRSTTLTSLAATLMVSCQKTRYMMLLGT